MATEELNSQPLPPKVDLGLLTEVITTSVRKALEERAATETTTQVFKNPRIIVGFIMEPATLSQRE
ncbi:hypothetical protein HF908_24435 (plasmid) [Ralstonia pseudosolanacearum]|uniref:hypothetical protein n=1 Tax=Ralstonia pseudosolanacearum TaxID=1310165 RepID=UPI0018663B75|nr:hypothetical protein [Ralstonia pseudosolanacearum]QOK94506.1 hypothetical protein HF908_24435 [Ralstonia pseudosolanacearum]